MRKHVSQVEAREKKKLPESRNSKCNGPGAGSTDFPRTATGRQVAGGGDRGGPGDPSSQGPCRQRLLKHQTGVWIPGKEREPLLSLLGSNKKETTKTQEGSRFGKKSHVPDPGTALGTREARLLPLQRNPNLM